MPTHQNNFLTNRCVSVSSANSSMTTLFVSSATVTSGSSFFAENDMTLWPVSLCRPSEW